MGSSVYHQTKHKRIGGLVEAVRAAKCFNCGGLRPAVEIFKGWCASCLASWGATADVSMLARAREEYALAGPTIITAVSFDGGSRLNQRPEPPTASAYARLKDRIASRRPDEWFIPMTLYIGNYTVGQAQANWNYLQALYELEVMTTAQAFKIGRDSFDLLHVCGRHAPMQSSSLASFIGRVVNSPGVWKTTEPRIKEYISDFISQQGIGFQCLISPRRRIDRYSGGPARTTRRSYRVDPNYVPKSKIPVVPNFWPFAVRQAPTEQEMLTAIDRATRGIPEQWRQDVCQDLVVAILSGETTLDNLRDAIPKHVSNVFKMHPIKYGPASLDACLDGINGRGSRTLADILAAVEQEDREDREATHADHDRCGWHAGLDRPVGLADLGEVARIGWGKE